jgi:orotidine-5'-phosphate decarboxylase
MKRPDVAVALDLPSAAEALAMVDALGERCEWYKVGPVLFVREGPGLIRALRDRGKRVFLDLKWYDIPTTVAGAVAAAAALGASMATVHLAGGARMLDAARNAAGGDLLLAGVGVLTSFEVGEYGEAQGRAVPSLAEEQIRMVRSGLACGVKAFVTAAPEAGAVRRAVGPDSLLVVPGIRGAADGPSDQRRVATAAEAVAAGGDLLVVGRPVTGASDPVGALAGILAQIGS